MFLTHSKYRRNDWLADGMNAGRRRRRPQRGVSERSRFQSPEDNAAGQVDIVVILTGRAKGLFEIPV
jgi:hypothetical protein